MTEEDRHHSLRLVMSGRVQGVGFRAWFEREARRLGLDGWVRNRMDGSVEALIAGSPSPVSEMRHLAGRGPRFARVDRLEATVEDPPSHPGFYVRR